MGMASSQARLLMITSRMHDIEYQAQSIQNAKLQLATQQDEAYEKYQQALDATTLTMQTINGTSGEHSTIPANFSNVFGLHAANPAGSPAGSTSGNNGYVLVDSRGRVVVEDEIYEGYQNYQSVYSGAGFTDNAYLFAWYMVEGGNSGHQLGSNQDLTDAINAVDYSEDEGLIDLAQQFEQVLQNHGFSWVPSIPGSQNAMSWLLTWAQDHNSNGGTTINLDSEEEDVINQFVNYFWSHYTNKVFNGLDENALNANGDDYNMAEFNYYVRIFNAIQEHGGCIAISDFNGPNGDAATNSEWLTAMIQSGQLSIEMAQIDGQGNFNLNGVSVSSDTNLSFTPTSSIDKAALAKAEAEYEHTLKVIDRKDKKYDLDLSKLDTERNALDKQREGIEKVIKDNVDRTFGIFS